MLISGQVSVAANAVSANVLAGNQFEFLTRTTVIQLLLSGAAVGLEATFNVGGINVCQNAEVSGTNRFPFLPDDLFLRIGGLPNERLFLQFNNTTAGAVVVLFVLNLD